MFQNMQSIELLTSFKRLRFRNIKILTSVKVNRLNKHGLENDFFCVKTAADVFNFRVDAINLRVPHT